jgi:potassium uptake TrkH family protein
MILAGSVVLILPNATTGGISYVDALFTSASAVCVTGLVVVDTGSHFSLFGQVIILTLIQLGGLGIMTFTSYFSYFFRGGSSYHNQLLLKDLTNAEKIAGVFSTLRKVILVTFLIEAIGAAIIFTRIDPALYPQTDERLFFSIFHAVSAFCNAGFSTLPDSFFTGGFRYNYSLHIIIASLFITGGLGFPILFNSLRYFRHLLVNRIFRRRQKHIPWVININTRIVLITTSILLAGGTVLFLMLEWGNTLREHEGAGRLAVAFFTAATPRTAGFNTVDTSALTVPAILLSGILMWIGASPGSTGGGIKTSTLAIGILNTLSIARGKDKTEIYRREISDRSIKRAFSIVVLSLLVITASVLLISLAERDIEFHKIVFESVSAFSTSGLSLGITAGLGSTAKVILILTMFTGRVSMMTILAAIIKKVSFTGYRYPAEDILIN